MKQQSEEAYVLRTRELGDSDLIVSLLAERSGQVRGVARSARRSRRRFGGALEPMTRVRAAWTEKPGRELHWIESLDCVRSFAEMQSDPVRQAACAILVELVEAFSREGEADPRDFKLLGAVLDALERGGDAWTLVRYFEYWTLRLHGLLPDPSHCTTCERPLGADAAAWAVEGHGVRCAGCRGGATGSGLRLRAADRAFLERARAHPPGELGGASPAARPGSALEVLLRRTLECFAERRFRSYKHLSALTRPGRSTA